MYGLFRWQREGMWARILTALQARAGAAGLITWEVNVGDVNGDGTADLVYRSFDSGRAHPYQVGAAPHVTEHTTHNRRAPPTMSV